MRASVDGVLLVLLVGHGSRNERKRQAGVIPCTHRTRHHPCLLRGECSRSLTARDGVCFAVIKIVPNVILLTPVLTRRRRQESRPLQLLDKNDFRGHIF